MAKVSNTKLIYLFQEVNLKNGQIFYSVMTTKFFAKKLAATSLISNPCCEIKKPQLLSKTMLFFSVKI